MRTAHNRDHAGVCEARAQCYKRSLQRARTWKQPRCPSADEWMRKLWHIHTMECYSAIRKNAFESVLMRWRKLEAIIE